MSTVTALRPNRRSVDEWASYIGETWGRVAEDLVATGARLLQARSEVGDDDYADVLAKLRMRPETAEKLIRISEDDRIAQRRALALPSSVETLLELTQLSDEEWCLAEEAGLFHTDLERKDVRKFRKSLRAGDNADTSPPPPKARDPEPEPYDGEPAENVVMLCNWLITGRRMIATFKSGEAAAKLCVEGRARPNAKHVDAVIEFLSVLYHALTVAPATNHSAEATGTGLRSTNGN